MNDREGRPIRGTPAAMSDTRLAAALVDGDPIVIDEVRKWIRSAISRQRATPASETEDLEQETLLELLESLDQGRFRGESRFETYVYAFARHRSIDRIRSLSRRKPVDISELDLEAKGPSPFDEARSRELERQMRTVLSGMSPECREIWSLIAQGLTYREMSLRLGVSEGTLRVRAFRCRQRAIELRDAIAMEGVTKSGPQRQTP